MTPIVALLVVLKSTQARPGRVVRRRWCDTVEAGERHAEKSFGQEPETGSMLFARCADGCHPRSCRGVVLPRPGSFPGDWRLGVDLPCNTRTYPANSVQALLRLLLSPPCSILKLRYTEPCHSADERFIACARQRQCSGSPCPFDLGQLAHAGSAVQPRANRSTRPLRASDQRRVQFLLLA